MPPRIGSLLDGLTELRALTGQARRLIALQREVRAILPADLSASTSVASLAEGRLTLMTENGAAAAKLRHLLPRVLRALADCEWDVTVIHVRVQVTTRVNPLPQKRKSVVPEGQAALRALAGRLKPSPLRRAVRRLAAGSEMPSHSEQEPFEGGESQKGDKQE